jgi:signal transduction histidine kinase
VPAAVTDRAGPLQLHGGARDTLAAHARPARDALLRDLHLVIGQVVRVLQEPATELRVPRVVAVAGPRLRHVRERHLGVAQQLLHHRLATSRDLFLVVLGHDLRGPLSGVNMSVQLRARPDLSEAARHQAAARIKRASRAMSRLITDLLQYTRARLGAGMPISRAFCGLCTCARGRPSRCAPVSPSSRLPSRCDGT